ncbi:MAG TPA: hypothetical protein VHR88_06075 [Solirubrobacteraceae bacterium]|nr:hypothetical protein [Solirubrobacteraceae bacterium]
MLELRQQHRLRVGINRRTTAADTLTVTVATPPLNELRGLGLRGVAGYTGFARQPAVSSGLLGPVRLTPYRTG